MNMNIKLLTQIYPLKDYQIMTLGKFLVLANHLNQEKVDLESFSQVNNFIDNEKLNKLNNLLSQVVIVFKKNPHHPLGLPKQNLKAPRYLFHDLNASASLNSLSTMLNLSQIIDRAIHHLSFKCPNNVMVQGYKRIDQDLECNYPNTVLNYLNSNVWNHLLQM